MILSLGRMYVRGNLVWPVWSSRERTSALRSGEARVYRLCLVWRGCSQKVSDRLRSRPAVGVSLKTTTRTKFDRRRPTEAPAVRIHRSKQNERRRSGG